MLQFVRNLSTFDRRKDAKMQGLQSTLLPTYNPSKSAAYSLIRRWKKTKSISAPSFALKPGNIIFTKYVAITKGVYDFNPCLIILYSNKRYVFGINVNWLDRTQKRKVTQLLVRRQAHTLERKQLCFLIRMLKKSLPFVKQAMRLYRKEGLVKQRLYVLNAFDLYEALSRNLIKPKEIKGEIWDPFK